MSPLILGGVQKAIALIIIVINYIYLIFKSRALGRLNLNPSKHTLKRLLYFAGQLILLLAALGGGLASAQTIIISDQYNAANSGTGFALGNGANSGINPPATRMTGLSAANLRYYEAFGTKAASAHYLTNSAKLAIAPIANASTISLTTNGTGVFDFGPALNVASATPALPVVYDLTINMANASASNQRCSFAISSVSGQSGVWDLGIQIYHANTTDSFYTLQKRIGTSAGGVTAINNMIGTVGTYSNEVAFLIRVTDAGAESGANYHSRVQVSVDGGVTWIYDSLGDADLPNGWRFGSLNRYVFWDVAPSSGPVTYDNFTMTLKGVTPPPDNRKVILSDSYDVTGTGSGFALGSGLNSGINPPVTRLIGSAATNLFYLKAFGTKPDTSHYITNNTKLAVALSSVGSSTLTFSSGSGAYDFAPDLAIPSATPLQPLVYDLSVNLANATVAADQRCSFAISSASGTSGVWDFGLQIYRTNTGSSTYTLQKRIATGSSGLGSALNAAIGTVGVYPNEVALLLRVTDAGAETGAFSSRIQVSVNGGTNWIYDTDADADLPNGWRFSGPNRYVFFDVAPSSGPVTYDDFSLISLGFTNAPGLAGPPPNILFSQMTQDGLILTWLSQKNTNYNVLKKRDLNASAWGLVTNMMAPGTNTTTVVALAPDAGAGYYRIEQPTQSGLSVSQVTASQRPGTNLVDIAYQLTDWYGAYASISVLVSTNGGLTYNAAAASFSGDVGPGISPGTNLHLVWNVGADWPGASATYVCVKVIADRSPVGTNLALVPAGTFDMGNTESPDGLACEAPVHAVYLDDFYAERWAVTKGLWDAVALWATNHGYSFDSPAIAPGDRFPVQQVSWYDAVKWCNARSEMEGLPPAYFLNNAWTTVYRTGQVDLAEAKVRWTGAGYRLLSEAEWEKAARGGQASQRFPWGDTINEAQANYWSTTFESFDVNGTSGPHPLAPQFPNTRPVGSFPPTGYGLYDMVGNTWVWCWDYYGDAWYADSLATSANTHGPTSASWGGDRVYRGGSGVDNAWKSRVANRADAPPRFAMGHFGFRVALPAGNPLVSAASAVFTLTP